MPTMKRTRNGVASTQDPNRSFSIQPETNQLDHELSARRQQSEEIALCSTQHATANRSVLEAPYLGGSAGNAGPQLQLPTRRKIPDTAQSIRFAMEGDNDGLVRLFS